MRPHFPDERGDHGGAARLSAAQTGPPGKTEWGALKLSPRLSADDERNEQLADPVPLELEGDRHAGPLAVIERLDRAFGSRDDRAADTAHRPGPRRAHLDHLLGPGQLPRTDPPGHQGSRAHRERCVPFPSGGYDATLPIGEVREVGHVREDVLGTTGYVDA